MSKISPDTALTLIRKLPEQTILPSNLRVVGLDDWAFRKGHTYGTILVDLETRQPLDLLPDTKAETVRVWLARYPQIEILFRDRGTTFSEAGRKGAPQAIQPRGFLWSMQGLGYKICHIFLLA